MINLRRIAVRLLLACTVLLVVASLIERLLEVRDVARFTPGETFAQVESARVRYRLAGAGQPGAPVIFLGGFGGTIEQVDHWQNLVAERAPCLAYDRAGYGFSEGSDAHTVDSQASELAALLAVLEIRTPVVLVGYSSSAQLARVFTGRYPNNVAGVYFVEPYLPEIEPRLPNRHDARRRYLRFISHSLVWSSLGLQRLGQRMRSWAGPESPVERRAEAILTRLPHYWALTREWFATPESARQTIAAPLPPDLPMTIAYSEQPVDDTIRALLAVYTEFAARSSRSELVKLPHGDHGDVATPGATSDTIVAGILRLSANAR